MGEYKDKHGETRFKAFLDKVKDRVGDVVPELAEAANNLAKGNYIGAVVDVGQGLSKAFYNNDADHDKYNDACILLDEFRENKEFFLSEMQEISRRWDSDNKQSSWLPKNIRPLTLAFIVVSTMIICVLDSSDFGFKVQNHWVDL